MCSIVIGKHVYNNVKFWNINDTICGAAAFEFTQDQPNVYHCILRAEFKIEIAASQGPTSPLFNINSSLPKHNSFPSFNLSTEKASTISPSSSLDFLNNNIISARGLAPRTSHTPLPPIACTENNARSHSIGYGDLSRQSQSAPYSACDADGVDLRGTYVPLPEEGLYPRFKSKSIRSVAKYSPHVILFLSPPAQMRRYFIGQDPFSSPTQFCLPDSMLSFRQQQQQQDRVGIPPLRLLNSESNDRGRGREKSVLLGDNPCLEAEKRATGTGVTLDPQEQCLKSATVNQPEIQLSHLTLNWNASLPSVCSSEPVCSSITNTDVLLHPTAQPVRLLPPPLQLLLADPNEQQQQSSTVVKELPSPPFMPLNFNLTPVQKPSSITLPSLSSIIPDNDINMLSDSKDPMRDSGGNQATGSTRGEAMTEYAGGGSSSSAIGVISAGTDPVFVQSNQQDLLRAGAGSDAMKNDAQYARSQMEPPRQKRRMIGSEYVFPISGHQRMSRVAIHPHNASRVPNDGTHCCGWDDCAMKFGTVEELTNHLQAAHISRKTPFSCLWKNCSRQGKPFSNHSGLFRHLRYHTGDKPCKCTLGGCAFTSVDNGELKRHMKLVHHMDVP